MLNIAKTIFRKKKVTSFADNLRFHMSLSENLVALGFFGFIFKDKLSLDEHFSSGTVSIADLATEGFWLTLPGFLASQWLTLLFATFIILWFFAYRAAVRGEMEILVSLYSRINPPHDWEKTIGARLIPLLSIGLTLAFFLLAYFMDKLEIFCIVMLALNTQDAMGNNILRKNMVRHFLKPQFDPHETDLHGPFIMKRREVALEYWVWKPQIERVGLMMIGTILAFLLVVSESVFEVSIWPSIPVFLIMAIILANELTMARWRTERNQALDAIDAEQEDYEREMSAPQSGA